MHNHGLYIEPHNAQSKPLPHTELLPVFGLAKTVIKWVTEPVLAAATLGVN